MYKSEIFAGHERYVFDPRPGCNFANKRLSYFHAIQNAGREITYEEAVKDCGGGFLHSKWHRYSYQSKLRKFGHRVHYKRKCLYGA